MDEWGELILGIMTASIEVKFVTLVADVDVKPSSEFDFPQLYQEVDVEIAPENLHVELQPKSEAFVE